MALYQWSPIPVERIIDGRRQGMIFLKRWQCSGIVLFAFSFAPTAAAQVPTSERFSEQQIEFFESKIRPILVERCFDCHGDDPDLIEGGLSLASRASIVAGGDSGPAIDTKDLAQSLLLDAINYGDLFEMPPDSKLAQEEIDLLTKWVEMEAPWPPETGPALVAKAEFDLAARKAAHWCWQPLKSPDVPHVKNTDWIFNEIDNFVLAKLEALDLQPADLAERHTLVRRAYFDLIGLPPTPRQVAEFVNDNNADAFEKVVDELLASPHFGERWARHWMDLTRYAETYGHEFDYPIANAFRYRDYLIRAFNEDVPFDEFVREHIAGDLLANPRRNPENQVNESIQATGFWFLGEATHGPVDVKGDEAGRIDNQIDVVCKTFLGITVACARCHDHKFDAISAKDYYALSGFLQSSRRQDVLLDPNLEIESSFNSLEQLASEANEIASKAFSQFDYSDESIVDYLTAAIEAIAENPQWLNIEPIKIEAESMQIASSTGGKLTNQELRPVGPNRWSGNKQLWWFGAKQGDRFTVEFEVPYEATYEVFGSFTTAVDYGISKISIDDHVVLERLDLYSKTIGKTDDRSLGKLLLAAGKHQLVVESTGTNPAAVAKFMFGLDYLKLVPNPAGRATGNKEGLLTSIAARHHVDLPILQQTIRGLADQAVSQVGHPLFAARQLAVELSQENNSEFGTAYSRTLKTLENRFELANKSREHARLFKRFSGDDFGSWFASGFAFGKRPTKSFEADTTGPVQFLRSGLAHSGRYGKRMYGVLRSPTFEIKHSNIHYRLLAEDVQIRLIIDGFTLDKFNPLLFNGMTFKFSSDGNYVWRTQSQDLKNHIGHRAYIEIIDHGDGFVAIDEIWFSNEAAPLDFPSRSARRLAESPIESVSEFSRKLLGYLSAPNRDESRDELVRLSNWTIKHGLVNSTVQASLSRLADQKKQIADRQKSVPRPKIAIAMTDGSPENEYVFIRGNHENQGDEAQRDIITALKSPGQQLFYSEKGSGRLYLANQIATADNPLTSRVIVNRLWHHLTGRGIVPSVDNFGVLGEKPSHPELLDYLAGQFTADGWSIKRMLKRIMMSKAYQISSATNPSNDKLDPANSWLHRARIRRLQGEAIRDAILHVSGQLDPKLFGRSVPVYLTTFMQGRGRPGKSGPLDGQRRRSIYTEVRRNFLSPMMLAFDTPIPFNAIGRRTESNVPAQALILMNNPFVTDQARKWATKLVASTDRVDERIEQIYKQAFARSPSSAEVAALKDFLKHQALEKMKSNRSEDDAADDRPSTEVDMLDDIELWADCCHVIFNVKEFIFLQ